MSEVVGESVLEFRFPSKADRLKLVRGVVRDAAHLVGCSAKCVEDVVIGVNEACMNVIQHAYHRRPDGEIILEIWRRKDQLIFRLMDFAAPVDVAAIKPREPDALRPGGLGSRLIGEVMDQTAFLPPPEGVGNLLEMVKRIR